MHDHNCEAEVYDDDPRRGTSDHWRPCRKRAAVEYTGIHLCLVHAGCAMAGKTVNLTGGRVLSQRKAVTVE